MGFIIVLMSSGYNVECIKNMEKNNICTVCSLELQVRAADCATASLVCLVLFLFLAGFSRPQGYMRVFLLRRLPEE